MAVEQTDQDTRSFHTIRMDAMDVDGIIQKTLSPLSVERRRVDGILANFEAGSDGWKSTVTELSPKLDTAERETLTQLEAVQRSVQRDADHLARVGYRSGLSAADQERAEAKAAQLAAQLPAMPARTLARAITGAVTFGDMVGMAAWASLADAIDHRFPNDQRIQDDQLRDVYPRTLLGEPLRECQRRTGDAKLEATRAQLETAQTSVREAISDVTQRRNAHAPSRDVGSLLLSHEFGSGGGGSSSEQRQRARQYDPAAVKTRLGR